MTDYLFPTSIDEALQLLLEFQGEAQIVAGGTDVMADLRKGKINPRCLVDITRIPGLDQIEVTEAYVSIGAAVSFAAIKDSPFLKRHVHALTDAARSVGAIGIQTAATWVGNIVQAMPAADGAIIAVALGTDACVVDVQGTRWRAVESLFAGPGVSTIDPTCQLISHLRFPRPPVSNSIGWGSAWKRIGRRPALVLPILNCAVQVCLDLKRSRFSQAAIALGPVAPHPFRAREAEASLIGQPPSTEVFERAADIVKEESNPRSSVMRASREYRLSIIPHLVRDALVLAAQRAQGATQ